MSKYSDNIETNCLCALVWFAGISMTMSSCIFYWQCGSHCCDYYIFCDSIYICFGCFHVVVVHQSLLSILPLQVFFVIRLHDKQVAPTLPAIMDPDPFISCELMDGRDAFLTMAREKHYEFSSLRRTMFSTMALLYELHNQGKDNFVYTCNNCKAHVETRYHCVICDVSILIIYYPCNNDVVRA